MIPGWIPNRWLRHVPVPLLGLNRGWPSSIIVEPTNICNLACPVCPTFLEMDRKKGFMSYETFKFIIDDMKGKIGHIAMNFAGEPTLNRDLWRFVAYAQANGVKVLVSTNSMLLSRQMNEILESRLDRILVCLDGTTKDVHEIYRRRSDFWRIRRGIEMLCQEKTRRGLKWPHINLQFLVMAHNEHQIRDVVKLGLEMGVDSLSLKSMSLGSLIKTEAERMELARKWLPKASRYNRYYISDGKIIRKEIPKICNWYRSGVIYWNGDVGICCYDFNGLYVIGNVLKDGGFTKIYKSSIWGEVQKRVMLKQFELCQRCNLTSSTSETINYNETRRKNH
jgi:MoaA/NifB/PqqE/SkfB family radical SAM enzyme